MHIVYVAQYFNLPSEPGGSRVYQFARRWIALGHRVTLITSFLNLKTMRVPDHYRGKLWLREEVDGIDVLRVYSYGAIRGSFRRRIWNFLTFAFSASIVGVFGVRRPDVVYVTSTPLTVGIPGLLLSWLRRAPLVFEVRDLWPRAAVVAGVLRPGLLVSWVERFARFLYRRARRVIALTRGIRQGILDEGIPEERVILAPNGVDDWIERRDFEEPEWDGLAGAGQFVGVYVGAHGMWNGLETILDAAAELAEERRFALVFIGDGDDRPRLEGIAKEKRLRDVHFLGALPKRKAMGYVAQADYCVVAAWDHPFQRMVFPNKIFDYLGCGRPTVVAAEGEMASMVEEARAGLVVPPEKPRELASAIRALSEMSEDERRRMGDAGREFVLARYRRRDIADRIESELRAVT
jgi:glycosyltransferase involved in cell wall biosynthesis